MDHWGSLTTFPSWNLLCCVFITAPILQSSVCCLSLAFSLWFPAKAAALVKGGKINWSHKVHRAPGCHIWYSQGSELRIKARNVLCGTAVPLNRVWSLGNSNILFLRTAPVKFGRRGGMEIKVKRETDATIKEKQQIKCPQSMSG